MIPNFTIFLLEENNYAELDCEGLDFTTTISLTDINDISTRKDTISKNIKLKGTKNNNRILGELFNLSRYVDSSLNSNLYFNYTPVKPINCQIFENNALLVKGDLRVINLNRDGLGNIEYECVITGSLVNLFGDIGDDLLTDVISFSNTHTYDISTILTSCDYTTNPLFLYPNIDYGVTGKTAPIDFNAGNYRTGIYVKTYLSSIFTSYGYSLTGEFMDSEIMNRAFIPYSEQDFGRTNTNVLSSMSAATGVYTLSGNTLTSREKLNSIHFDSLPTGNIFNKISTTYFTNTVDVYQFNRDVLTAGEFDYSFTAKANQLSQLSVTVYPYTNGVLDIANEYGRKTYPFSANTQVSDSINIKIPYKQFNTGDGLIICTGLLNRTANNTTCLLTAHTTSFKIGDNDLKSVLQNRLGDVIALKDVIPQNVKVKDFLKSIIQFFNLYLLQDPDNEDQWLIETYDTFYKKCKTPMVNAVDWTYKLDHNANINISYNTQMPSRYNFVFKEDSDLYNELYKKKWSETYGNFTIINSNGTASEKNIEVDFSPTVIVRESTDDKSMPAIFKGELTNKQPFKSNLRILFNNGYKTCQPYNIVTGSGSTIVSSGVTNYNTSSHLLINGAGDAIFNLQFGLPKEIFFTIPTGQTIFNLPTLYSDLYAEQIIESNNVNMLTYEANVWLNENDISSLDLRKPVYINSHNGQSYFKIVEVSYSSSNVTSNVKLQKIVI